MKPKIQKVNGPWGLIWLLTIPNGPNSGWYLNISFNECVKVLNVLNQYPI